VASLPRPSACSWRQTVNTAAALDATLAAAKAVNGPALIVSQVDPHDLPAELA
jgi:hypothetical protein